MSTESDVLRARDRARPSEVVSGYLSAIAIFGSLVGVAWHPLRLIPLSMLLGLVAATMSTRSTLARAAVMIVAVCFFLGMTVSVVTSRPLW